MNFFSPSITKLNPSINTSLFLFAVSSIKANNTKIRTEETSKDMAHHSKRFIILVMLMVSILGVLGCSSVAQARLLGEEEEKLMRVIGFVFEVLPQGPATPSGPSGCTHGPPRGGRCPPWIIQAHKTLMVLFPPHWQFSQGEDWGKAWLLHNVNSFIQEVVASNNIHTVIWLLREKDNSHFLNSSLRFLCFSPFVFSLQFFFPNRTFSSTKNGFHFLQDNKWTRIIFSDRSDLKSCKDFVCGLKRLKFFILEYISFSYNCLKSNQNKVKIRIPTIKLQNERTF